MHKPDSNSLAHPADAGAVAVEQTKLAPDAEAKQWRNIQKVVRELAAFCFGGADHTGSVSLGAAYTALVNSLTAKDGLQVKLEPLASQPQATPDATVTLNGYQLREALDLIAPLGPDGSREPDELAGDLTFGMRTHRDDDGIEGFGMCCWNDDTDGVLPLDEEQPQATPLEATSEQMTVEVKRNRVWIVKGVQSFMLAYEADTSEELNWYASQLRGALSGITPCVKSAFCLASHATREQAVTPLRIHAHGGGGIHDYEMSDGTIKTMSQSEARDLVASTINFDTAEGEATSERKPLTDAEIETIYSEANKYFMPVKQLQKQFARLVEQHHGIGGGK